MLLVKSQVKRLKNTCEFHKKKRTSCTKAIAGSELPHAGKELGETTTEECHSNDDIGGRDATGTNIVKGEDQRRRCKGEKSTINICHKLENNTSIHRKTHRGPGLAILVLRGGGWVYADSESYILADISVRVVERYKRKTVENVSGKE